MGRLSRIIATIMVVGTTTAAVSAQTEPRFMATNQNARISLGSIRGTVSDDRGGPLSGAMVSALGVTTAMVMTDARGRFALDALPPGEYIVRVHLAGFLSHSPRQHQSRSASRDARAHPAASRRPRRGHLRRQRRHVASAPRGRTRCAPGRGTGRRQHRRPSPLRAGLAAASPQAQRAEGHRRGRPRRRVRRRDAAARRRARFSATPSPARRTWRRRSSPIRRSPAK